MAIPTKRHERNTVSYLDLHEIKALLSAPDPTTWLGRRDHALLLLMIQTGVRVSELVGLRVGDIHLGTGAHIKVTGKGRKKRATTADRAKPLRSCARGSPNAVASPTTRCSRPGKDGRSAATRSALPSPSTPPPRPPLPVADSQTSHPARAAAFQRDDVSAKDVDIATIALWLGHESTQTTHIYEHADPALKEQAIARTAPLGVPVRHRPPSEYR